MFNFRRLFQLMTVDREGSSGEGHPGDAPPDRIRVLAVTQSGEDEAAIRRIAAEREWEVSFAVSSASAQALLEREPRPLVIICDRDLPGEDWRTVVSTMASLADGSCVLLASSVADDYLWEDVIKHKGYDVILKPFEDGPLGRIVAIAESRARWRARLRA